MAKNSIFQSRMPMYFGGLALGLAAMVGIFMAKRAMMPKFHEVPEERAEITVTPGASVRFVYSEEPGYFLIPGMPTGAILARRTEDGKLAPVVTAKYRELTEKEPALGPLTEEGKYNLDADFFICAEPGVAYCTKLMINQDIVVDRNAPNGEDRIEIDLRGLAEQGLKAGKLSEDHPVDEKVKTDKVSGEE